MLTIYLRDGSQSLAAGAIWPDGRVAVTVQRKATEYGCSADAVLQLLPLLLGEGAPLGLGAVEAEGEPPAMLLVVDQFGLLHAPTGPVRLLGSLLHALET